MARVAPSDTLTPADRYQELFVAVQTQRIFDDSKTFVDSAPREHSPARILQCYREQRSLPGFDLAAFVNTHFRVAAAVTADVAEDPRRTLRQHIDMLWPVLTRQPRQHPAYSSILPLPYAYVVPGGRFTELYYWDSYFTMLGLAASGRTGLLRHMANNFAYLIEAYGHIPNGNRTYYLSRSQPPVFALMVELFESAGVGPAPGFLAHLRQEYAYWMDGAEDLRPGEAHRHVVRTPGGHILNRYWDDRDTPREESYIEDSLTARRSRRPVHEVYRDLRAGAASGWDFSSRWLDDGAGLESIRTTAILPVDLNSFLYRLELKIGQLSRVAGDGACAAQFLQKADDRKAAIDAVMWNAQEGAYFDYDWKQDRLRDKLTAACVTPLFTGAGSPQKAQRLADTVARRLLRPGGIGTTEIVSGEQWDRPNGWAPLQWIAVRGFQQYGQPLIAGRIRERWLAVVRGYFARHRKIVEKYALSEVTQEGEGGGGGEYPLQDGFGWTNGVTRALLAEQAAAARSR